MNSGDFATQRHEMSKAREHKATFKIRPWAGVTGLSLYSVERHTMVARPTRRSRQNASPSTAHAFVS